jgi:hypothetical protein
MIRTPDQAVSRCGLKREEYLKEISDHLGRIAHQVEVRTSIRLFDLNIMAEDFYMGFLNLVYGLNLVNLNVAEPNAKAIDLGDSAARKCIQVTSDNSIGKIRDTTTKFDESKRDVDYDELIVLLLTRKKNYKNLPAPSKALLLVKDYTDLIRDIRNYCNTIVQLKTIACFLEEELVKQPQKKSEADELILETFAGNASRYIAQVAEHIVTARQGQVPKQDLDNRDLLEKFKKMKCSSTYKKKFDRHAAFFHAVNEIIETDAIEGGAATIRAIVGIIQNIYSEVLNQSVNGDRVHNQIQASLLRNRNYSAEEITAAETLIFYTINECGIFNESK